MTSFIIQNDFTHGEIDPRLLARVDIQNYYKSAQKLRNVYALPQGGVTRRQGTIFEVTFTANEDEYKIAPFEIDEDLQFLLLFIDSKIIIYKEEATGLVQKAEIITNADWTGPQASELKVALTHNRMIITHPDAGVRQLKRITDVSWDLTIFDFTRLPAFDFGDTDYDSFAFSLTKVAIGPASLTSSVAVFTTEHVGGSFIALGANINNPVGVAHILTFTSTTQVEVQIVTAFDASIQAPSTCPGTEVFLGEPAFSATRGWPVTTAFYENRLWFGGTRDLPETLFGSKIGTFRNFDQAQGLADEAVIVTIATREFNRIRNLESDQTFQIFGSNSEFNPQQAEGEPITPSTVTIRKQSSNGSTTAEPVALDNRTFYVRKGGRAVMSYAFRQETNSYDSLPVSILSPQLIRNPIDSAALKGHGSNDANYIFFANEDGTLVSYQTVASENVSSFTLNLTGPDIVDPGVDTPSKGKFKRITTLDDTVYVITRRDIGGVATNMIESLDFDSLTDASIEQDLGSPQTVITGLGHLEGETVRAVSKTPDGDVILTGVDGLPLVVSAGQITVSVASQIVEVGLNFNTLIRPVPVNVVNSGRLYTPKRIVRAFIDFVDSINIKVNDNLIPFIQFGPCVFGPHQPSTQSFEVVNLTDWSARQTVDITQTDPAPMTIIGIGYEVQL